jgi:hypothetical protein
MLYYKDIKIADHGYILSLPEREDRRKETLSVLDELNISGYTFFDGIRIPDENWRVYGCTESYINIFKDAIDNQYESIVVFEDDIKIMNGVSTNTIDEIFSKWHHFSQEYDVIALGTRPQYNSKIIRQDNNFGKISNLLCTQCFLYKNNFIEYAYEKLKCYRDPECSHYRCIIDEFINDCCSHEQVLKYKNDLFNIGITIPMIFTQRESYSDNEGIIHNYDQWMEGCFWAALEKGDAI